MAKYRNILYLENFVRYSTSVVDESQDLQRSENENQKKAQI